MIFAACGFALPPCRQVSAKPQTALFPSHLPHLTPLIHETIDATGPVVPDSNGYSNCARSNES